MKVKIKLLRPFANIIGKNEIDVELNGNILEDVINLLVNRYPQLQKEFYPKNNDLSEYICIFINDKALSASNCLKTKLMDSDEILFFIPLSGG